MPRAWRRSATRQLSKPDDHLILPELISKEPLGPSVRRGDDEFFTIAKWVVFALIEAEEYGITQANVDQMKADSKDPVVQRILGTSEDTGKLLGLDKDWAYRAIKASRQLRRDLRAQRRPEVAAQAAARRQQPVEQGRLHVRAAGEINNNDGGFAWRRTLSVESHGSSSQSKKLVLAQQGLSRRAVPGDRARR